MISEETRTKINHLSGNNQDNQQSANTNDKDKDKVKDKDEAENKFKLFENEGVVFKAKLIGSELVMEPRGDKMCQNSIQRLKAIIKGTNSHKKRIVLKISYDGVKVYDEKTNEILHHHEVSQISYIASDDTDNRTFGYVSDVPNKAHQFICFKTSGPAINVMSVISSLFDAVVEKKNQADKAGKQSDASKQTNIQTQDSVDLIGDSGIMDGDSSIISTDGKSSQQAQLSSSILIENNFTSTPGNSFSDIHASSSLSNSHNNNNNRSKQSASSDLLFNDLFAGLSDPIIVDKNDSLISYAKHDINPKSSQHPSSIANDNGGSPFNVHPQRSVINAARPIPKRQNHHQYPVLLPPPSSLPRPMPTMISGPSHNRSLVYNHSSVSLSDAALTHQSSFNSTTSSNQNDSYVDRYAVFNDIDNLPSIFESTSLGNVNTQLSSVNNQLGSSGGNMFRQTNPFDDDFFA